MYYWSKKKALDLMRDGMGFIMTRCLPTISMADFAHLAKAVRKSWPERKVGITKIGGDIFFLLVQ